MKSCVCGSKKAFSHCCEPLLTGKSKAKTIRQLVRSRYAAYALGGQKKYLMQTWHPATAENLKVAELDTGSLQWQSLEIVSYQQKGDLGHAEFIACYIDEDGDKKEHHEISVFRRFKGVWFYLDGKIIDPE